MPRRMAPWLECRARTVQSWSTRLDEVEEKAGVSIRIHSVLPTLAGMDSQLCVPGIGG